MENVILWNTEYIESRMDRELWGKAMIRTLLLNELAFVASKFQLKSINKTNATNRHLLTED